MSWKRNFSFKNWILFVYKTIMHISIICLLFFTCMHVIGYMRFGNCRILIVFADAVRV